MSTCSSQVTYLYAREGSRSSRQGRVTPADGLVLFQCPDCHQRPDSETVPGAVRYPAESGDPLDVYHILRIPNALTPSHQEISAAGHDASFVAISLQHGHGLPHGTGFKIFKSLHDWFSLLRVASFWVSVDTSARGVNDRSAVQPRFGQVHLTGLLE